MGWGALAGAGASVGLGLMLEEHNDKRALWNLQDQNRENYYTWQKQFDHSWDKQYDMWKKTGPVGQMEQYTLAGLNPGLMYGMSGGGGQTTGSAGGQMQGAQLPQRGGEIQAAVGMGLQLALQQAQIENIKADTNKKEVEAAKTGGVDTEQTKMATEKLFQEWQNLRKTHDLQELQIAMQNIENFEKQTSQGNRLRYIQYQTETALHNLKIVQNENKISDATINDQIKTIKQEAIYAVLKNAYTKAQTTKTVSDITVNDAQMRKWSHEIMQNWDKMDQGNRELMLKKLGIPEGMGIESSLDKILNIIF